MTTPKKATIRAGTPPPAKPEAPYDWPKIATKLRRRPGKWYEIFTGDRTTYVTAIRAGHIAALKPADGFECRTTNGQRPQGQPRTCDLWMRYNPDTDQEQ